MAWFGRGKNEEAEPVEELELASGGDQLVDDGESLRPVVQALGPQEQARIDASLAELEAEGVDVGDLASLSAGLDAAYAAWTSGDEAHRPDHAAIVERYAIGVGAHLDRTTDLDWQVVTDVFGTDLSMTEGFKGSFVVVPHNLVAGRWMRGETNWIPAVIGHIVRRRTRR